MIQTDKELALEKYIEHSVYMPSFQGDKWIEMFIDVLSDVIKQTGYDNVYTKDDINWVLRNSELVEYCLSSILTTPRSMKLFGRCLYGRLVKFDTGVNPSREICFLDLIFLVAIQSVSPILYTEISKHRKFLVNPDSDNDLRSLIQLEGGVETNVHEYQFKQLIENSIFNSATFLPSLFVLFFRERISSTDLLADFGLSLLRFYDFSDFSSNLQRVNDTSYFSLYFSSSTIPKVASVKYSNRLNTLLGNKNWTELKEFLLNDWENLRSKPDLKRLYIKKLKNLIVDENLDDETAFKLFIILGELAKCFEGRSGHNNDKSLASGSVIPFIVRFTDRPSDVVGYIKKLFNSSVSHMFITDLTMIAMQKSSFPSQYGPFNLNAELQGEIRREYITFFEKNFFKDKEPLDYQQNSDVGFQVVRAFSKVSNKKCFDYLKSYVEISIKNFISFIDEFYSDKYTLEFFFEEQLESLEKYFPLSDLLTLYKSKYTSELRGIENASFYSEVISKLESIQFRRDRESEKSLNKG